MKRTTMLAILMFGLMVWPASVAEGRQYLTVNGASVTSITLELGQSYTVEVISTDSTSYMENVGFDNGLTLGSFYHLETKPEAGDLASVAEINEPDFYGYFFVAHGESVVPSPGVHFVFQCQARQIGETDLKLYNETRTSVIDSVHITVIPGPMGTAFTYQGQLLDKNKPANGLYDFQFKVFEHFDPNLGSQQGSTIDINDLDVIEGSLIVELDFGSGIFTGDARWLEISLRPGNSNDPNDFVTLSPRQEMTPMPYALQTRGIFVDNAGNVGIGTTNLGGRKLRVAGDVEATRFYGDGSGLTGITVSQAKLNTATGEVSHSGMTQTWYIIPGGTYSFSCTVKMNTTATSGWRALRVGDYGQAPPGVTSYTHYHGLRTHEGQTIYEQSRYIQSLGKDYWIFLLIAKNNYSYIDEETGKTVSVKKSQRIGSWQAPNHPSYNSGDENNVPHPFPSYDPEKHEIILVDNEILPELKERVTSRRSLLTVINEDYEVDIDSNPVYQPREIVEIDEHGDKDGEIIDTIKTPEWAKIMISSDEIFLKRRMVDSLPYYIKYRKLRRKDNEP